MSAEDSFYTGSKGGDAGYRRAPIDGKAMTTIGLTIRR
jgi:hypothetical protein